MYHRPPSSIKTGNLAGQGFLDKVTQQLINAMPDYQHGLPLSSPKRTETAMREGKQVCHPVYLKTKERMQFAYFSKPSVVAPSIRLVGLSLPETVGAKRVNLEKLHGRSTFTVNEGRAYNEQVDTFINSKPEDYKLVVSVDKSRDLFLLIANGKVDYTFSYPIEVNFFNKLHPTKQLQSWHIKGVNPYVLGYVACSKTAWGKDIINHVNQVLGTLVGTESYLHDITSWWPEELQRDEFVAFYENQLLRAYQ